MMSMVSLHACVATLILMQITRIYVDTEDVKNIVQLQPLLCKHKWFHETTFTHSVFFILFTFFAVWLQEYIRLLLASFTIALGGGWFVLSNITTGWNLFKYSVSKRQSRCFLVYCCAHHVVMNILACKYSSWSLSSLVQFASALHFFVCIANLDLVDSVAQDSGLDQHSGTTGSTA